MFSLIRSGPRILLLKTDQIEPLSNFLSLHFGAISFDLDIAFDTANENNTILYLLEELYDTVPFEDVKNAMVVEDDPLTFMCKLYALDKNVLITSIRTAPHILIMRGLGNLSSMLTLMQSDMGGEIGEFKNILNNGNDQTTIVALTDKPLNKNITYQELHPYFLRLDDNYFHHLKELRMHALSYINCGIDNKDWYEMEIRIYDRYSAYSLHYDRLIEVLEELELGIVLGESWSKDYPRFLMSVEVYRIRFFSFTEPKHIKYILLGLEYLDDGTRIVDYDIYYNHKKVDWNDTIDKKTPKIRHEIGKISRNETFSKISQQAQDTIHHLEEEIVKTRTS
ncbi:hypothetical protein [Fusibacter bizertensis]